MPWLRKPGRIVLRRTLDLDALLRSNGFKFVFGITYHLGKEMRLERLKQKTLLISQSAGWSVILKILVLCATKLEKILKKTAESCANFKTFSYLCENIINQ